MLSVPIPLLRSVTRHLSLKALRRLSAAKEYQLGNTLKIFHPGKLPVLNGISCSAGKPPRKRYYRRNFPDHDLWIRTMVAD